MTQNPPKDLNKVNKPDVPDLTEVQNRKHKSGSTNQLKGGNFITQESNAQSVFIPEELSEEQRMIADMVEGFCISEIQDPLLNRGRELEVTREDDRAEILQVIKKAGELGLCSVGIPEEFGGMDLDFKTNTLFSAAISNGFSLATTLGAQTSIGSLPIVYYGNDSQKKKYLPGIASGELIAAYALTEPDAGSDANSGKTKAVLNEAGTHYLINGQKIWITNGGFADVFIVFAKIDDDKKLSAFIVERNYEGFTVGPEEKKMGIKGSSTTQIYFDNCPVPTENRLGDREGGFKMALTILNGGRLKAAAGAVGGIDIVLGKALDYATERKQFDTPIANFGAIQYKIGDIAARGFANESALFRTADLLDQKVDQLKAAGKSPAQAKMNASREFAIEASILKVEATDLICYAVDEGLQIFGGMGYAVETGIEMGVRDARITKIYEGTNEINALLAVGELTKRGVVTKEIDLIGAGKRIPGFLLRNFFPIAAPGGDFSCERRLVQGIKNAFLLISGAAGKKLGKKLIDEQEIVLNFYDLLAEAYISECAVLRIQKLATTQSATETRYQVQRAACQLYLYEALKRSRNAAFEAIDSFEGGTKARLLKYAVSKLLPQYRVNPKDLRRQVAQYHNQMKKFAI